MAVLLCLPVAAVAQQEAKVEMELRLSSQTVSLGHTVATRLVFTNVGRENVYVRIPRGSELEFNFAVDGCRFRLFEPHADRSIDSLRFLYVPLAGGARYETQGTSLNDGSFGPFAIRLPRVGNYEIRLRWRSRANDVEGAFWPIWNDPVDAPPVSLRVEPPDSSDLARYRRALLSCNNEACDEDALAFFSLAKDPAVADKLEQLFRAEPPEGRLEVLLAGAIARQGRKADADLLKERADLGRRTSSYLWTAWNDLVERVGGREPCPK